MQADGHYPGRAEERLLKLVEELRTELTSAIDELRSELTAALRDRPPQLEAMLSVAELAALLACDPRSVHRWWRQGAIPAPVRVGGVLRWHTAVIRSWLREQSTEEGPRWRGGR